MKRMKPHHTDDEERKAKRQKVEAIEDDRQSVTLLDLPIDQLVHVVSYLKLFEAMTCSHVCRVMRDEVVKNHLLWDYYQYPIDIEAPTSVLFPSDTSIPALQQWLCMFSVYTSGYRMDLCKQYIRHVRWVMTRECTVRGKDLEKLVTFFPRVNRLSLKSINIVGESSVVVKALLSQIDQIPDLQHLQLDFPALFGSQKDQLRDFVVRMKSKLRSVSLRGDFSFDAEPVELLVKHHPDITSLSLFDVECLSPALTNIDRLSLNRVKLSDQMIPNLTFCNLKELTFVAEFNSSFNYNVIGQLVSTYCPLLHTFSFNLENPFSYSKFPDKNSQHEGETPVIHIRNESLRNLRLRSIYIHFHVDLLNITMLQANCVRSISVPDENNLRILDLDQAKLLGESGLVNILSHCTQITQLSLRNFPAITDVVLDVSNKQYISLQDFPQLRSIGLSGQTESALTELAVCHCPNLISILPVDTFTRTPQFKSFMISNCPKLSIVGCEDMPLITSVSNFNFAGVMNSTLWSSIIKVNQRITHITCNGKIMNTPVQVSQFEYWIQNRLNLQTLYIDGPLTRVPQFNIESATLEHLTIILNPTSKNTVYIHAEKLITLSMAHVTNAKVIAPLLNKIKCTSPSPESGAKYEFGSSSQAYRPCSPSIIQFYNALQIDFSELKLCYSNLKTLTIESHTVVTKHLQMVVSQSNNLEALTIRGASIDTLTINNQPRLKKIQLSECSSLHMVSLGRLPELMFLGFQSCRKLTRVVLESHPILFDSIANIEIRFTALLSQAIASVLLKCKEDTLKWVYVEGKRLLADLVRVITEVDESAGLDKQLLGKIAKATPKQPRATRAKKETKKQKKVQSPIPPTVVFEEI